MSRGALTVSLDFELVWGSRDLYDPLDPLLKMARITREQVFDGLLSLFDKHHMVATWATVGCLFRDTSSGARSFSEVVPPKHAWYPRPWFANVPEGSERDNPEFFARTLVKRLRDAGQEVGSHSFSHPIFGDTGCSREAAESDLAQCVREATELGISLRSFVFPRNRPGHVDLLRKYGFTCWRGREPVWYDHAAVPGPAKRLAHLAEVASGWPPPTVLPYKDEHGLWVIPGSASILPLEGIRRAIPVRQRVKRCLRGLDQAAANGQVCHLWFHPINFASAPKRMLSAFEAVLEHASRLRAAGRIECLSMGAIAERCEAGEFPTIPAAKAPSARS